MEYGWEAFYGLATVFAVGLSWKQGGPIAIASSLIGSMWAFQLCLYMIGAPFVGNMMSCMIDGTLLFMLATLPRSRTLAVVMASLMSQLFLHVSLRQGLVTLDTYYVAINVLYILQLIALGWSGGRIVLVGLGAWMASVWNNRSGVYGWASRPGLGLRSLIGSGRRPVGASTGNSTATSGRRGNRSVDVRSGGVLHLSIEKGGRSE